METVQFLTMLTTNIEAQKSADAETIINDAKKQMGLSAALFEEAHPAKDITILSNDNLNLYGAYYKNEAAASDHLWAIVIHGYRCDHNSMTEFHNTTMRMAIR